MIIIIYNIINILLTPIYLILLLYRILRGKEEISHIRERFGSPSASRPSGYLIWIHVASVGEALSSLTIIEIIKKIRPDTYFLVTSITRASGYILKKNLGAEAIHQFAPIDNIIFVRRFLKYWKIDLGIFIESELWPCIISEASKTCKLLLLNARLSDRSFKKWQMVKFIFRSITSHFSHIATQSPIDFKKFKSLGVKELENFGNLKFANQKLGCDDRKINEFKALLNDKKIILFVSSHYEDEIVILKIIKPIKQLFPNAYFIMIPRHITRRNQIAQLCKKMDLSFSFMSQQMKPLLEDDLYIIDKMGEVGLFYNIAYISFIGGSFAQGGHNPIEALHFNTLIIFGPNMTKCQSIADEMTRNQAAFQINNYEDLFEKIRYFLSKEGQKISDIYIDNGKKLINHSSKIIGDYETLLKIYLDKSFTKKISSLS